MKNKKWIALIFFGLLLITTFQIINPVSAEENPSGYIIIGNKVIWNTSNGYLEVYPHTSNNAITQIQYCNFTWKKSDTNIDMAFIFNNKLLGNKDVLIWKNISHIVKVPIYQNVTSYYELYSISNFKQLNDTPQYVDYGDIPSLKYYTGKITFQNSSYKNLTVGFDSMRWLNIQHTNGNFTYHYLKLTGYSDIENFYFDWYSIKDKFNYTIYSGKHYYYYKDIPIIHNKTYNLKWVYDIPINNDGKWELLLKLSSDTLLDSYATGRYVLIDPWYSSSWLYCKKITIDHTKVSSTLTNFPVLFDNISVDFNRAQLDGDDFIFVKDGNLTKYNHAIEYFSSNRLIAWVNITTLSSTIDTILWLYYGNPSCSNQQNNSGTWKNSYKLVHHMNDTTTSKISDMSINNYDGTKKGANEPIITTSGKIEDAQSYDGTNDYVSMGNVLPFERTDTFSGSAWIYLDNNGSSERGIISKYYLKGWVLYFYMGRLLLNLYNQGSYRCLVKTTNVVLVTNCWINVAFTYTGSALASGITIYINGSSVSTTTVWDTLNGYTIVGTEYLYIGASGSDSLRRWFLDGIIDEVRVLNIVLNSSWISTEYNNQKYPNTFLSVGIQRYLAFPIIVSEIYPSQNSTNITLHTILSIHVHHLNGQRINISFWLVIPDNDIISLSVFNHTSYGESKKGSTSNITFYSTTDNYYVMVDELGKQYHWFINVSDGVGNFREFPNSSALLWDGKRCYDFTTETEQSYLVNNGSSVWVYLGAMLTLDNGQFFLLILIGLWSYFIYLYYKEKEVIFSFCIICCGLPLGIILSGVAYYNSYPFGYLISFILILISFLIPTYGMYQKNKKKK